MVLLMTTDVAGLELGTFEAPVEQALEAYYDITKGALQFDILTARQLKSTIHALGYSAVSRSFVHYRGRDIGHLHVVAMAPGDGTGLTNRDYQNGSIDTGDYPHTPRVVPVPKDGAGAEFLLGISSHDLSGISPFLLFANSLDSLGFETPETGSENGSTKKVVKMGTVGLADEDYFAALHDESQSRPDVTLTVGGREDRDERYGDPSAIFNSQERIVQVSGILTVREGVDKIQLGNLMVGLQAHEPLPVQPPELQVH